MLLLYIILYFILIDFNVYISMNSAKRKRDNSKI